MKELIERFYSAIWSGPDALDPILPGPDPATLDGPASSRPNRVAIAGADKTQEPPLRRERLERLPFQGVAEVRIQRWPLTHREDPRLLARMPNDGRDVSSGKHLRM